MSMNLYLKAPDDVDLQELYPPKLVCFYDQYPDLTEDYPEDCEDPPWGYHWVDGRGWCIMEDQVPTVNMSNSNMMYVLKDIIGLDIPDGEYCGTIEDLPLARASLMLHNYENAYYGIRHALKLVNLAMTQGWEIYYA